MYPATISARTGLISAPYNQILKAMKRNSAAILATLALAFVLSLSSCSGDHKKTLTYEDAHGAGKDTTLCIPQTSCDQQPKSYTSCDGKNGSYLAYKPGKPDTLKIRLKLEGAPLGTVTLPDSTAPQSEVATPPAQTESPSKSSFDWSMPDWLCSLLKALLYFVIGCICFAAAIAIGYAIFRFFQELFSKPPQVQPSSTVVSNTGGTSDSILAPHGELQSRKITLAIEETYK